MLPLVTSCLLCKYIYIRTLVILKSYICIEYTASCYLIIKHLMIWYISMSSQQWRDRITMQFYQYLNKWVVKSVYFYEMFTYIAYKISLYNYSL